MSYKVIARKYRPLTFKEVVGQNPIIKTLENTLKIKKIGQAYLFNGPRGVGKTTIARILARSLNCIAKSFKPCNQCKSCQEILLETSLDYYEIDGASNRGIDQIREIQSSLNFSSPSGDYRIFVIDEVHMLTIEAFNALLKSLEEPPKKVIFILCTTEINKIPLTIRSRCQNFQFKNISSKEIAIHLEKITINEKIDFEKGVFIPIARKANGSIRDSENLLEQVILYSDTMITLKGVEEVLGETSLDLKLEFIKNLYLDEINKNKRLMNVIFLKGIQIEQFLFNLLESFSNMIFLKEKINNLEILEINPEEFNELKEKLTHFSVSEIFTIMDVIFEFISELKNTNNERILISFMLIKLHRYKNLISPEALKKELMSLAKQNLSDKKVPVYSDSDQVPRTSPQVIDKEFNEKIFYEIIKKIKKEEFDLYRFAISFEFKEIKNGKIILYDKNNLYQDKLVGEKERLTTKINEELILLGINKINEIIINESMLKSNVDNIKTIFGGKE